MQTTFTSENKSLSERLYTLRHLPPNTSLPPILIKEDQQLLKDLLQLPDDVEVLPWLQNNLDTNVVRIALRVSLEQIGTMCQHIQAASSKIAVDAYYKQLLGGLLELSGDVLLSFLHQLEENNTAEDLLHHLRQLQLWYQKFPNIPISFRGHNEREQVFTDLLNLPQDVDPLSWLKQSYAEFTARLVLSHLLDRFSIMHGSLMALPTIRTLKVNKHFYPHPGVDIKIENIIFKSTAFLVQIRMKISSSKLSLSGNTIPSSFIWNGFERVADNFGYHYLSWVEELNSGGTNFHGYQEQLTMAMYPAITMSSKELTFSSQPIVIETSTVSQEGHPIPLPDIVGNNLLCNISLS